MAEFELPMFRSGEYVIIPLNAHHSDDWTERLGLSFEQGQSKVLLDSPITHHIAAIAAEEDYALIETDYFGGAGDQVAAVYDKGEEPPRFASERSRVGAINEALRAIGVTARKRSDEFETLGLDRYRDFEDVFEKYYN